MDSILSEEPESMRPEPLAESDSPAAEPAEKVKEAPVKTDAPKAEPVKAQNAETADDDGEAEESSPGDLDGYKRALAAARGDKRKSRKQWQEAEKKLAMLEGELRALRVQPQQQKPAEQPKKTFWDGEPEQFIDSRFQSFEEKQRFKEVVREERIIRATKDDADEAIKAFIDAAKTDPALHAAWQQEDNSAFFAYEKGKALLVRTKQASLYEKYDAKTPEELETKIRESALAGHSEESAPKPAAAAVRPPIPPKSLAGVRGSGAGVVQPWAGPRPFESIFPDR